MSRAKCPVSVLILSNLHAGRVYPASTLMDDSAPDDLQDALDRMQEAMELIEKAEALLDRAHQLWNESDARLAREIQRRIGVN